MSLFTTTKVRLPDYSAIILSSPDMRHEAVSPCGSYTVQWSSDNDDLLIVHDTKDFKVHSSFNLVSALETVAGHVLFSNGDYGHLEVTQISWEYLLHSKATKFGVVVQNLSVLVIFELGLHHRDPIVIPQSHHEGLSHFEWIPPNEKQSNKEPSNGDEHNKIYTNCIQLCVFTRNNILLKVYSLARTRVVFTIVKPVVDHIIVRPSKKSPKKRVYWSVLATSSSDANKCTLYHFVNEGDISTLFYTIELDVSAWCPRFGVSWSLLGNFFGCFNQTLSGFELSVYNSLGAFTSTHRETGEPILRISKNFYNDVDLNVPPITARLFELWLGTTTANASNEYSLVAGLSLDNKLTLYCFCINTFRIEQTFTLELYHTPNIPLWRKLHGGSDYRKSTVSKFPLAQRRVEIRNIQVIDNKLLVVQLESHIFLYVISVDHLRLSFELKGLFMFDGSVKNVIAIGKGNIMITTRDCVYHYQSEEDKFNLVYENMLLQGVHYNNDTVYLITALEWDKVSLSEPAISEQRFNVSGTEEVTDTFALQRLKKRKL